LRSNKISKALLLLLVMCLVWPVGVGSALASGNYVFALKWGQYGRESGEFDLPAAVAVDGRGDVYVLDTFNHRIQKFNSSGAFLGLWGSQGGGEEEFNSPWGIAVTPDVIYVADTLNHRVQVFYEDGSYAGTWGREGDEPGYFNYPSAVAVDGEGYVYVVDTYNNRIQKFDRSGGIISDWHSEFNHPQGIAIDGDGNVYVTDTYNNRVQKFDTDGSRLGTWGSPGSGDGEFWSPVGIAVDRDGHVYVADVNNHRIQKFDGNGAYITQWGSQGTGNGQFWHPNSVAVDAGGNVYVADKNNHRIQKFTLAGGGVSQSVTLAIEVQQTQTLTLSVSTGSAPEGGSVTDSNINFGVAVAGTTKTGSHRLAVTTSAVNGYFVTAEADRPPTSGSNQIADVTGDYGDITETTAGDWNNAFTYGFGYTLANWTGSDAVFTSGYRQFADRSAAKAAQVIMANDGPTAGSQVDVVYKLIISPTQPSGVYTNTITYIATGNF
jgi:sugar lactone lactonase YvrE